MSLLYLKGSLGSMRACRRGEGVSTSPLPLLKKEGGITRAFIPEPAGLSSFTVGAGGQEGVDIRQKLQE